MTMDPTTTAVGTWSGGRFMHFGEPVSDERLTALLRPGAGTETVITADVYGEGEADRALATALEGVDRDRFCLVGAIGHDFYEGEREGAKGFPRFTDARLRDERAYADYIRMATERSLLRCGVDRFDVLLLHNPDRVGYKSEAVWAGMEALREAGLVRRIGVAPGPANGFTLDLIDCFERFGAQIDWAMIILNPLEPWPGELVLAAAAAHGIEVITRVVDYGGLFHDDVSTSEDFAEHDHRRFRPAGWVGEGRQKLERMRPFAATHDHTMLQLACAWNLAHDAVSCVAPTLIQERGPQARPIEDKRAELDAFGRAHAYAHDHAAPRSGHDTSPPHNGSAGARGAHDALSDEEVRAIRAIGDNTGTMTLKGASPDYTGPPQADRWSLDEHLDELAARWSIDPQRDLAATEHQLITK
jgi:aryl-alcohol dehydrogenase-like predicted oxidoreductase